MRRAYRVWSNRPGWWLVVGRWLISSFTRAEESDHRKMALICQHHRPRRPGIGYPAGRIRPRASEALVGVFHRSRTVSTVPPSVQSIRDRTPYQCFSQGLYDLLDCTWRVLEGCSGPRSSIPVNRINPLNLRSTPPSFHRRASRPLSPRRRREDGGKTEGRRRAPLPTNGITDPVGANRPDPPSKLGWRTEW